MVLRFGIEHDISIHAPVKGATTDSAVTVYDDGFQSTHP